MKLIEYNKFTRDEKELRILSARVFHKKKERTTTTKTLCGILFRSVKQTLPDKQIKTYTFLNLLTLRCVRTNMISDYFIGNFKIYSHNFTPGFIKKYKKQLPKEYENFFIINGHSGELYTLCAFYVAAILNKYKNVKFLCTNSVHKKIWNLFWSNIEVDMLEGFQPAAFDRQFNYNNQNFYYTFAIDPELLGAHRIDASISNLNLTRADLIKKEIIFSEQDKMSFNQKLKNMKLNTEKFVIFAPEAESMQPIHNDFWKKLANGFKEKGYDIYLNALKNNSKIDGIDSTFLTYPEIMQLAKISKGSVSLRSGFTEFLSYYDIPVHVIYTYYYSWEHVSIEERNAGFAKDYIKNYPFRNKDITYEYKYFDYDDDRLIDEILAKF